ncbi:MAG: hypothetical protein HUU32_18940 [Calditrichaceae bacterium]|nr:hypothetical protein [Calditrichia bacterium]NUQ43471.1 hypothetical protein [Calditrichaceae bacterium]
MERRKKVCFVSDQNTCRSIIAEVYLRNHGRDRFEVQSFGLSADRVHFLVQQALTKREINPNYSFSKVYDVIENQKFDYVVLLHPSLKDKLPRINYDYQLLTWNFDPLLLNGRDEEAISQDIARLCDQIEARVKTFVKENH